MHSSIASLKDSHTIFAPAPIETRSLHPFKPPKAAQRVEKDVLKFLMPGADVSRQALAGSNSELALECKMSVLCKFVKITPNFSFAR